MNKKPPFEFAGQWVIATVAGVRQDRESGDGSVFTAHLMGTWAALLTGQPGGVRVTCLDVGETPVSSGDRISMQLEGPLNEGSRKALFVSNIAPA